MGKATIGDLKVDLKQKLNNDTKKQLVKIIEDEFINQTTLDNEKQSEAESKVLEDYKKKVKFDSLVEEIKKAEGVLEAKQGKLSAVGLDENGGIEGNQVYDPVRNSYIKCPKAEELQKKIAKIARTFEKPRNYKNKIISRLWLATTMSEACVILNNVLGNGILPSLDTKDLLQLEAPKQ